jgi:pyruvate/2-oxoglutarate dehydrogenase complex dihydrolipoamide acyltransferase (E2) component
MALFACPLDSTSSSVASPSATRAAPRLSEFIAYALHRTRLPLAVTHQALFLLRRLKQRFPAARGSSGHRLFISALMLASKSSCDDTYSNKSWTIVGQGLFCLREVNQMERELFGYLGFKVNVKNEELVEFVAALDDGCLPSPCPAVEPVAAAVAAPEHVAAAAAPSPPSPSQAFRAGPSRVARASISGYPHDGVAASASCSNLASHTASTLARSASVSAHDLRASAAAHPQYATPYGARERSRPYTTPTHNVALSQAAASAASQTAAFYSHLSPSVASLSSSRGSISSSCDSSDSGISPGDSCSSSSSCTTPETPPSELGSSPWTNEKALSYDGEPAGTYDDQVKFYQPHLRAGQHYAAAYNTWA